MEKETLVRSDCSFFSWLIELFPSAPHRRARKLESTSPEPTFEQHPVGATYLVQQYSNLMAVGLVHDTTNAGARASAAVDIEICIAFASRLLHFVVHFRLVRRHANMIAWYTFTHYTKRLKRCTEHVPGSCTDYDVNDCCGMDTVWRLCGFVVLVVCSGSHEGVLVSRSTATRPFTATFFVRVSR